MTQGQMEMTLQAFYQGIVSVLMWTDNDGVLDRPGEVFELIPRPSRFFNGEKTKRDAARYGLAVSEKLTELLRDYLDKTPE